MNLESEIQNRDAIGLKQTQLFGSEKQVECNLRKLRKPPC